MLRRTNASIPVGVQEQRASNGADEGTSERSDFDVFSEFVLERDSFILKLFFCGAKRGMHAFRMYMGARAATALLLAFALSVLPTPCHVVNLQRLLCAELVVAESRGRGSENRLPLGSTAACVRGCAIRRMQTWGGLSGVPQQLTNAETFRRVRAAGNMVPLIAMRGGTGVKRARSAEAREKEGGREREGRPAEDLEDTDAEQGEAETGRDGKTGPGIDEESEGDSETIVPGGSSSDEDFSFHT